MMIMIMINDDHDHDHDDDDDSLKAVCHVSDWPRQSQR